MAEEADSEMARRIAAHVYSGREVGIPRLVGQGLVNHVYGVSVGGFELVVRFCRDEGAAVNHQKEAWCIRQATEAGVPGPTVLTLGTLGDASYMAQTFLEGTKGEEAPSLWPHIWRELGRYARLTHSITTQGFGGQLADAERRLFSNARTPTWAEFVVYNIASLTAKDALLGLGVYSARQREEVVILFEKLLTNAFRFGLCHSDLKPRNTVVGPTGGVSLLDWGSAMVHIVPHVDIAEILRWQDPKGQNVRAFLEGYGLSWAKFTALLPQVELKQPAIGQAYRTILITILGSFIGTIPNQLEPRRQR